MEVDDAFADAVLEVLTHLKVRTKRAYGGLALLVGETIFGVIYGNQLYFHVDEATRMQYVRARMGLFAPYPSRPPMTHFMRVPPGMMKKRPILRTWARRAMQAAGCPLPTRPTRPTR
jgi:TfoX/Sxy family transcriptional regulator of competence genes